MKTKNDGLNMRIIGFGGPRKIDERTTTHSGRWARILANTTADAALKGEISLNALHLDGREIDTSFDAWKDVRGVGAPAINNTLENLKNAGIAVKVNDYDINEYIVGFKPNELRHSFDNELFEKLHPTDLAYISTSAVDKNTGRDGHFPFIDALLQYFEGREPNGKKPVILVDTPMTMAYETTKHVIERAKSIGVNIHEFLVETLDPAKPITIEYIKQEGICPSSVNVVRADNQINYNTPAGVCSDIIKRRANPLWEKGIHEPVPIIRLFEEIYGVPATLENINVVHAEPFITENGEYLKYLDGTGKENYCAVSALVELDVVIGEKRVPVRITESFNRKTQRYIEIYTDDPEIDKIFMSSLTVQQHEALREKYKDKDIVSGYFSQTTDGNIKKCIVSPIDDGIKGINPLQDFILGGVCEVYNCGVCPISQEDSLLTAKYVEEMNLSLQQYLHGLIEGETLRHNTNYIFVIKDTIGKEPLLPVEIVALS